MTKCPKHILITGTHRSGTTWVGKTVSLSSNIRYIEEPFNVSNPNKHIGVEIKKWYEHVPTSDNLLKIKKAFDQYLYGTPFSHAVNRCRSSEKKGLLLLRFLRHFRHFLKHPRILIKDPIALLSADWLYETYKLQVVCMIRNPLAFAGSMKKAEWGFDFVNFYNQQRLLHTKLLPYKPEIVYCHRNNVDIIDQASLLWNIFHHVIYEYQKKYPSWLFMRHEDLARSPVDGFEKIFNYLDAKLDHEVLEKINQFTSNANPAEGNSTEFGPRDARASLETWKNRLTIKEMERVTDKTKDIARKFYPDFGRNTL